MAASVWAGILGILLMLSIAALGQQFRVLRNCYFQGISFWARWVPVMATLVYMILMIFNISRDPIVLGPLTSFGSAFSLTELMILFIAGPLFFTRIGGIVALMAFLYSFQSLLLKGVTPTEPTTVAIVCSLVVAILADKMPWHRYQTDPTAGRIRDILVMILGFSFLVVTVVAMLKVKLFSYWIQNTLAIHLHSLPVFIFLVATFALWLLIVAGGPKHFTLPLICLPSSLIVAFVTNWPNFVIVIPFFACLALSLVAAERRVVTRYR